MKIEKIEIKEEKFDINLKFYFFLKYLIKVNLSYNQTEAILNIEVYNMDYEITILKMLEYIDNKIKQGSKKQKLLLEIFNEIDSDLSFKLFIFSLELYSIKDLLLQEAKITNRAYISKLKTLHPLSLEYDKVTLYSPYSTRVNGALLSLMFFEKLERKEINFISKNTDSYLKSLSLKTIELKSKGVEPNQIFMLMFSESINQSIISDSGSNYEDRIFSVLTSIGVEADNIKKIHDKNDSSTEFDFFFEIEGKSFGIGAKKTLRERYKQFIKTAQMSDIDVMIEITLGVDLTEEKVKAIRSHDVYLFVSNEIYQNSDYLKKINGIYSVEELNIELLTSLGK